MSVKEEQNHRKARRKSLSFLRAPWWIIRFFVLRYWGQVIVACCCSLGLMLARSQPRAQACTVGPDYPYYTLEERTLASEMILEGVVTSTTNHRGNQIARVMVLHYFKNQRDFQPLPQTVTVSNLGDNSFCLSWVEPGEHLIFFVRGNPNKGLMAFYLEPYAAVAPATPEVISAIIEALRYHVYLPLIN